RPEESAKPKTYTLAAQRADNDDDDQRNVFDPVADRCTRNDDDSVARHDEADQYRRLEHDGQPGQDRAQYRVNPRDEVKNPAEYFVHMAPRRGSGLRKASSLSRHS